MDLKRLLLFLSLCTACLSAELTFELLQHDKSCFYQVVENDIEVTLEYQVGRALARFCDIETLALCCR